MNPVPRAAPRPEQCVTGQRESRTNHAGTRNTTTRPCGRARGHRAQRPQRTAGGIALPPLLGSQLPQACATGGRVRSAQPAHVRQSLRAARLQAAHAARPSLPPSFSRQGRPCSSCACSRKTPPQMLHPQQAAPTAGSFHRAPTTKDRGAVFTGARRGATGARARGGAGRISGWMGKGGGGPPFIIGGAKGGGAPRPHGARGARGGQWRGPLSARSHVAGMVPRGRGPRARPPGPPGPAAHRFSWVRQRVRAGGAYAHRAPHARGGGGGGRGARASAAAAGARGGAPQGAAPLRPAPSSRRRR
jgi:hypothetical protein